MAFAPAKGKSGKSIRVTGFFVTKRKGLRVGSTRNEELPALMTMIKQAYAAKMGVAWFLWSNPPDPDNPKAPTVSLSVSQEQPKPVAAAGGVRRARPIEADPFDDDPDGPANIFGED